MANRAVYIRNPLTANLIAATKFAETVVDAVLERNEAEAQNDMRQNAPWTDRTGNARNGLFAQQYKQADEHGLVMYHTVPYGLFLETRFSGRDRVIMPAVQRTGRKVMKDLRLAMKAM